MPDRYPKIGFWVWFCVPLIVGVSLFIHLFRLQVIETTMHEIPAYKFTFISVLMAVGVFQYNFFYQIVERFRRALEFEDYGPLWGAYIDAAKTLTAKITEHPEEPHIGEWQTELAIRVREINNHVEWHRRMLRLIIIEGCIRFILIFAVGLGLLVSLSLDIIRLTQIPMRFNTPALSQSFLFGALFFFICLFFFYILAFGLELSERMRIARPPNAG